MKNLEFVICNGACPRFVLLLVCYLTDLLHKIKVLLVLRTEFVKRYSFVCTTDMKLEWNNAGNWAYSK